MIEARSISYRFPHGDKEILKNVSLTVQRGEIVALMGENGSGKTTLARCLTGLVTPSIGEIVIDGTLLTSATVKTIRRKIGMIFQDPNAQITSPTVERELAFGLQNLGCGHAEMIERVERQIHRFHLEELRAVSPMDLSGGEKQLVAFAAVTIMEPDYLVLDEITTFLTGSSRQNLLESMKEAKENIGMVLITQFPEEAMMADRVLVLHDGSVVMSGTATGVFSNVRDLSSYGIPVPLRFRLGLTGEG